MGLRSAFRRLFFRGDNQPSPTDDFWYGPVSRPTLSNQYISQDSALRISAVYACVRVLSETLAQVPLIVYRRLSRGRERAFGHPLYDVLHSKPNEWQTSFVWRQQCMAHILLHGNSYNRIVGGARGFADQLIPLNPLQVRVEQLETGRILYHYTSDKGQQETLTQDDVFHLRGLSLDGVVGLSPIAYHRETFGMALAQQEYGARFYANDARPGGVLEHPGIIKDKDAVKQIKEDWQRIYAGAGRHSVALLQEGMKFNAMQMTHEDQQYIETRKFSVTDIARIYRVQPHLVGDLERSTFSNIEHQGLEFLTYTMVPWFVMWEQQISADLILAPQTYYAEFLTDGLLRGDLTTRYAAYATARNNGWMSANEIREKENMNPRPDQGGDAFLDPLNYTRSDQPLPPQQGTGGQPSALVDRHGDFIPVDLRQYGRGHYVNGKARHDHEI